MTKVSLGRRFALLWTANTISCIGDGILLTAGPLLMLSLTTDPSTVASAQVAVTLPYLVFGLVGGVAVDRMDRRRLMAVLGFASCVLLVLVVLALEAGLAQIPILLISLFLLSAGDTVFRTAAQTVLPSLVESEGLVTANGRLMGAETVGAQFLGPALGGLLFAGAVALPFLVDGVSFGMSGLLILFALPISRALSQTSNTADAALAAPESGSISDPASESSPAPAPMPAPKPIVGWRGVLRDSGDGVRWLWQQPSLRFLAGSSAMINFFTAASAAILVIYVHRILDLGGFGFGVIQSCAAIGGVLAGLAAGWIATRLGVINSLAMAAALQAVGQLILFVASDRVLTVLGLSAASFATVQFSSVSVALRQTLIPDAILGRVTSVYRMFAWGSLPVGAVAAGLTVSWFGLRFIFGLGAACMAALMLTVLLRAKSYGLATATS